MNAPQLFIPGLFEHLRAEISWDAVPGATSYRLERRFDRGFDDFYYGGLIWNQWETVWTDWDWFEENIASWDQFDSSDSGRPWFQLDEQGLTFDEFDALGMTWADLEALEEILVIYDGPNTSHVDTMLSGARSVVYRIIAYNDYESSDYSTSDMQDIIPNRPPVVMLEGDGDDLGEHYTAFSFNIIAYDPDPESSFGMTAYLYDDILLSVDDVVQNELYEVEVSDSQIRAIADNRIKTITVVATDNWGATSITEFYFTAIENLALTAIYYVLRDGIPIAKINRGQQLQWTDFTAAGTHTYMIRAVDRLGIKSDSNEIELTTSIPYASVARAEVPEDMLILHGRIGERPGVRKSHKLELGYYNPVSRRYPIVVDSGQRNEEWNLSFTLRDVEAIDKSSEMVESGNVVLWRDIFNHRFFGVITSGEHDYSSVMPFVHFDFPVTVVDYVEAIEYD